MKKSSVCLFAVLTILTVGLQYQVFIYQAVLPTLLLPNNTAYLNLSDRSRDWRNCKWFDMCDRYAHAAHWPVLRRTEVAFRG